MERITTGVAEIDEILMGGFPARAIHAVIGPPGSGKTILCEQMAFANAAPDQKVLYLTTLSEPLPKFLAFVQTYSFADVERIGTEIVYDDLFSEGSNPDTVGERLVALIQEHRPKIIVIDSFKAIADLSPDLAQWRRILYEVAGLLTAYDTTTFWVGEYTSEMTTRVAEFAVIDGILEIARYQQGTRDERFLRVLKLRGSGFQDGYHALRITGDGLEVYPRLVTPASPPAYTPADDRVSTGVEGVDAMLVGGWRRGGSILVAGPSGSGKTIFGLHFLARGVEVGEPGLLVNFQENPIQTARNMRSLGFDAEALLGPGKIDHNYISPVELQIDSIVRGMIERVNAHGVQRVVIDAIGDLERSSLDPVRFRDYLYALTQWFASRNITVVLAWEKGDILTNFPDQSHPGISYISDNILVLGMHFEPHELKRTARVVKSRGSIHDGRPRRFEITERGVWMELL